MKRSLHHVERLSSAPEVMRFARQINAVFLRQKLTELKELESEMEAVYLLDVGKNKIVSIICFFRIENEYYLPVVWTSERYRGKGCVAELLGWLSMYAASKGAKRLSTDVHQENERMVNLLDKHWKRSFIRFNFSLTK